MRDIDIVLGEFVRGQLSVMLILAVYYSLGLWISGLTFWAPVGIFTGLLIFIPYVGFGLGLLLALLVATLQFEGWSPLIGVVIVYGIGQLVESMLLTPFLVGRTNRVAPSVSYFCVDGVRPTFWIHRRTGSASGMRRPARRLARTARRVFRQRFLSG